MFKRCSTDLEVRFSFGYFHFKSGFFYSKIVKSAVTIFLISLFNLKQILVLSDVNLPWLLELKMMKGPEGLVIRLHVHFFAHLFACTHMHIKNIFGTQYISFCFWREDLFPKKWKFSVDFLKKTISSKRAKTVYVSNFLLETKQKVITKILKH